MNDSCGGRHILMNGLLMVLLGLFWGLVVPHTPFPRLALSAHIGFEGSGVLFTVVGILLLALPNRMGNKSIFVMALAAWTSWIMLASEVANSWWGTTQILPVAAGHAGATGGTPAQEAIVKFAHILAGLVLIVAWILLIVGFAGRPAKTPAEQTSKTFTSVA